MFYGQIAFWITNVAISVGICIFALCMMETDDWLVQNGVQKEVPLLLFDTKISL